MAFCVVSLAQSLDLNRNKGSKKMRRHIIVSGTTSLVVGAGLALFSAGQAHATPSLATQLAISVDGNPAIIYTGSPLITQSNINDNGLSVLFETVNATANLLTLNEINVVNTTDQALTVNVVASGMNFPGPGGQFTLSGLGTFYNSPGSSVTMTWYADPNNALGATGDSATNTPGVELGSYTATPAGSGTSSYSNNFIVNGYDYSDSDLFSMTEVISYTLAAGGELLSRGQAEATDVPEPGSLLLLGTGLMGIGLIRRHRRGTGMSLSV
jgi:hypothetical protein